MRGILINVYCRSISEVDVPGKSYKEITALIGCDLFAVAGNFNEHNDLIDSLYVDDEGLCKPGIPLFTFRHVDFRNQQFAGNGLILGINLQDGESISARADIFDVASMVEWTDLVTS